MKFFYTSIVSFFALGAFAQGNTGTCGNDCFEFNFDGTHASLSRTYYDLGCDQDTLTKEILVDGSIPGQVNVFVNGEQDIFEAALFRVEGPDGTPGYLDLSDPNASIELKLSATTSGQIQVLLADDVTIDPMHGWTITASTSPAILLDYQVSQGEIIVNSNNDSYALNDNGLDWRYWNSPSDNSVIVDSTQIRDIWIMYRKDAFTQPDCDHTNQQIAGTLTIKSIKFSNAEFHEETMVSFDDRDELESDDFYPNPVSEVLNFHEVQSGVVLWDINGQEILKSSTIDHLDVSDIQSGVYILESDKGKSRLIIE